MIKKQKDGKFRLDIKIKINGTFKHINKLFNTKQDAIDCEERLRSVEKKSETVEIGFKMKDLIEDYKNKKKQLVRISSYDTLCGYVKHIEDYFDLNSYVMSELKLSKIIAFKKYISNKESMKTERKNRILQTMKEIIERAVIRDYISSNLQLKLNDELDRIRTKDDEKRVVSFWTYDEFQKFIKQFNEDDWYYTAYNVLFFTGLRKSEFFGLEYEDFDEENRTLYIHQQYDSARNRKLNVTKTPKGTRHIHLDDFTYDLLVKFKQKYYKKREKQRIFVKSCNALKTMKDTKAKKAGLTPITIHDLRRSHCSYLIQCYLNSNVTVDFLAISERLGHSVSETMNVYAMMYPNANNVVKNLLNNFNKSK